MELFKTKKILILLLVVYVWLTILVSCSSGECMDNKNSMPLAGFYSSEPSPQQISIDSISVYGLDAPEKSLILDSVDNVKEVYLPFRIDGPLTTYIIDYHQKSIEDSRLNDTITFRYEIIPFFMSKECGAIYKYKIEEIATTNHLIDSVTCPLGIIDNVASENLKIYLRVQTES